MSAQCNSAFLGEKPLIDLDLNHPSDQLRWVRHYIAIIVILTGTIMKLLSFMSVILMYHALLLSLL